ncbi:hypothetical protein LOTGIDRAFT_128533 [Lottia gigantea]|uniref:Uncharacterized protein n=1 Tax=Lottia gigantea TaxID=225164 RepID=V3ZR20_LOTGI|nr:hypothetical protein LOTGIDRAFT_128533 [Lottia gigantea]ESO86812.1 hypothetical protein LOTGIDRAFT_128533 [Lottia gigantea]
MNKKCARCEKTVYPTEEIKCLDRVWHKFCFKCDVCGMTLNMKNYKGYNKRPYCTTHYPTTKHTAVAETPEMRRIAENTKIQSNVMYHADFEKSKGKKTSVMDDPEIQRIKKNTAIQSNVQYQNVAQRKHDMEARRPEQVGVSGTLIESIYTIPIFNQTCVAPAISLQVSSRGRTNPGKISEYEPQASGLEYQTSHHRPDSQEIRGMAQPAVIQNGQRRQPGSITDYDPMAGYGGQGYSPAPAPQPMYQGKSHYRAIYDYTAADDDEVSFREGDVVINCEIIDAGWMTGTIQRTGTAGMLPSNYVEPI